ncbi:MAG: 50S ribosomal protein L4 [Candidatus Anstonellales archaeon]
MNVPLYNTNGEKVSEVELPPIFGVPVKFELIKRAVIAEQTQRLQPKSPYRFAGMETSAKYRGRKDSYGSLKNRGQAMLPREVLPKGRWGKVRRIPSSVKGRRAHPPKVEKIIHEKINKKERRAALISALAATANPSLVLKRGHKINDSTPLPIVVDDNFEALSKTKDVLKFLSKLIPQDILRSKGGKKRKTGVRKRSSKVVRYPKSALIVASENSKVLLAARNLPGIDVCTPKTLSVELLAPGTYPGRLTIFTQNSLSELSKL